ncbi:MULTISPECIES: NAD(P)H-dependent oxidoreductase [Pseudomonas]|nr:MULTISPECIES: NAD(P)H-dependent oxidoreductase [Pseudomonas]WOB61211.1 NAD(P)H-dependent oxidoreductase [Pseudomonas sp. NBB]
MQNKKQGKSCNQQDSHLTQTHQLNEKMNKTLIVVAHPNLDQGIANSAWTTELETYQNEFTTHHLYKEYPDGIIDVRREQELIESHSELVLQFPLYWFNCPPLLKKWLDDVFTYGWAYGKKGESMKGRTTAIAVSAGISESDFQKNGRYKYSLSEILTPFKVSFDYVGARYKGVFALYGITEDTNPEITKASSRDYIQFLRKLKDPENK